MRKMIGLLTILVMVGSVSAYRKASAPKIPGLDKIITERHQGGGNYHPLITPADVVEPAAPDIRALLGSPGKNVAVKGDTVIAITGEYSGDPDNFFNGVKAYYSFDGGSTWSSFYLSTALLRRIYPGVIWPDAAGISWAGSPSPLFFWHEAYIEGGAYQPSKAFIAWDILWPNGIFNVIELPNSQDLDVWLPSADAKGDTIIVVAVNIFTDLLAYYWVSHDGGTTWIVAGDTMNPSPDVFTPIPRIGHTPGYMCALMGIWDDVAYPWGAYVPYFGESTDGGLTWTWQSLWDLAHGGNAPYDSCAGLWWYTYDMVIDQNDVPLIVVKYAKGNFEYGDVWFYRPTSGSPGNWQNWTYQLMVGDGQGGTIATQPYITIDPVSQNIFFDYKANFIVPPDTNIHIGVFGSADGGQTWFLDTLWDGFDAFDEEAAELPVYSPSSGGSCDLHLTFCNYSFATPSDTIWHAMMTVPVGIQENTYKTSSNSVALNLKNNGNKVVINFALPHKGNVEVSLYNAIGRKIATLYKGNDISKTVIYEADRLADGVYFVKLTSTAGNSTAKLILTK